MYSQNYVNIHRFMIYSEYFLNVVSQILEQVKCIDVSVMRDINTNHEMINMNINHEMINIDINHEMINININHEMIKILQNCNILLS